MSERSRRAMLLLGMCGMAAPGVAIRVEAAPIRSSGPGATVQAELHAELQAEGAAIDRLLDEAWFQLEIERNPRAAIAAVEASYGGHDRPRRPMDRDQATRAWALRLSARALLGVAAEREFETAGTGFYLPEGLAREVEDAGERVQLRDRRSDDGETAQPVAPVAPHEAREEAWEEKHGDADGSPPPDPAPPIETEHPLSSEVIAPVGAEEPRPTAPSEDAPALQSPFGEVSPIRTDVDGWAIALDERARAWRSRLRAEGVDMEVFALLGRSFAARELGLDRSLAYQVSTYHLGRRTRDDVSGVANSWELSYGNGRSRFDCRMTTDQLSLLYPLVASTQGDEELAPPETTLDVETGTSAVLHVERAGLPGGEWYRLSVLECSGARYAIVAFRPETALPVIDTWTDRRARELQRPEFELGLELERSTTARVCMHGANSFTGTRDRGSVTARGGLIPRGARYLVDAIEGHAVLDAAGGSARLVIGARVVAEVVGSGERTLSAKGLGLWVRPGEEPTVYLELQGRGRAQVAFSGALVRD